MNTYPPQASPRPSTGTDTTASLPAGGPGLLTATDPSAITVLNPDATRPVLLVCDHAGRRIPQSLGTLGLGRADLHRHIAWDIGAELVTRHLAMRLQCCAVLATYSRLVIDCNRAPGSPDSIPTISDGTVIPGNQALDESAAEARLSGIFEPYHGGIARRLQHLWRTTNQPPALIAIHSFTPSMRGSEKSRPWHIGILWERDGRIAEPLMDGLAQERGVIVGDNEPYSGWVVGYTVAAHGASTGLPRLAVEIRQDLIANHAGAIAWADRLATALEPVLAQPCLRKVEMYAPGHDGLE